MAVGSAASAAVATANAPRNRLRSKPPPDIALSTSPVTAFPPKIANILQYSISSQKNQNACARTVLGACPRVTEEIETMSKREMSRRDFMCQSAIGSAAGAVAALWDPASAAAQSVGVKRGDLPDLTIKEVKVYVTDLGDIHKLNSTETGE